MNEYNISFKLKKNLLSCKTITSLRCGKILLHPFAILLLTYKIIPPEYGNYFLLSEQCNEP